MFFYADLHIHSKYSRATSKDCNLEQLAIWAQKKGLCVISTGDFTHPAWFNEIKEKLIPDNNGAFRLKPEIEKQIFKTSDPVRFLLSVEISTIYKKGDKTRKVHHVVFVPDMQTAENFRNRLGAIGNINSDGRPILGLDSRNLLETVLESGEGAYIIPAHIWTPWFSVLGSKSGFDSIEECYEDLSEHIFAVETGLSSDPEMNWRVSKLDKFRLVSNSDAHSPSKLAREATVFNTAPDYYSIMNALKTGDGYVGTVEFFPEEGKYHEDGHRKCNVCLSPEETKKLNGICPVCGKPMVKTPIKGIGIEIDTCYSCGGIFLDNGEYDAIRQGIKTKDINDVKSQNNINNINQNTTNGISDDFVRELYREGQAENRRLETMQGIASILNSRRRYGRRFDLFDLMWMIFR